MLLEPHGMELFWELYKRLNGLKLVTEEVKARSGRRIDPIFFYFHKKIQLENNHPSLKLPVAQVYFNGGENHILRNEVTGVTLRIYLSPLFVFGLEKVLENYKAYRSELKESQVSSYYNYVFVDPYSSENIYRYLDALFTDLHEEFQIRLNPIQENLPLAKLPDRIYSIPEPMY